MGRIARLIWIDEVIWTQFQALYPRQASKTIEDTLKDLVNLKLDVSDEQAVELKIEKERLQEEAEFILNRVKELDLKEKAWKAKKREEMLEEKRRYQERMKEAFAIDAAIDASDFLRDKDVV